MCRCCEGKVDATAADIGKLWIRKRRRCRPGLAFNPVLVLRATAPRSGEVRCKLHGYERSHTQAAAARMGNGTVSLNHRSTPGSAPEQREPAPTLMLGPVVQHVTALAR